MEFKKLTPLTNEFLESIGFTWHTNSDNQNYINDKIVKITEKEANAYYEAAETLYDMYVNAAQYVIDNNLFHEIGIPFNLIEAIKLSWENDVHWHLYGRFDLAGGIDNNPIKLIEFNADTPTLFFETAIMQWALLKANKLNEEMQFNSLYESVKENFRRLITLQESTQNFEELYDGWKILFSCVEGSLEDENTTKLLCHIAKEAGFEANFAYVHEVEFSDNDGVIFNGENYEYWFKLIPWESIAVDEGELALILTNIIKNQKAIILNPAYTLLFQSKGIMKILWDLYPNHPLLLETKFTPLENKKCVKKPFLGREGSNIQIIEKNGQTSFQTDGEYENQRAIYQEYANFNEDENKEKYQAGLFFAYEGCGLGFRISKQIHDDFSKFVGHYIE